MNPTIKDRAIAWAYRETDWPYKNTEQRMAAIDGYIKGWQDSVRHSKRKPAKGKP